jgi:hypothetical protein
MLININQLAIWKKDFTILFCCQTKQTKHEDYVNQCTDKCREENATGYFVVKVLGFKASINYFKALEAIKVLFS